MTEQLFTDGQLAQLRALILELLGPGADPAPTDLGEPFPIRKWADDEIARRGLETGPAQRIYLATIPERVIYPRDGMTDRERDILSAMAATIAKEPPYFPANIMNFTARLATDTDGQPIPRTLAVINFNPRGGNLGKPYVEKNVQRWNLDRLYEARRTDHGREPKFQ